MNRIIIFSSESETNLLGKIEASGEVMYRLDPRYWERLFKYFVFLSWDKRTYYLNYYEDCLSDLNLEQEINLICSSEF